MLCDVDAGLTDKAAKLSRNILGCDKGSFHVSKDENPVEGQQSAPAAPDRCKLRPQDAVK